MRQYQYENTAFPHALTGLIDEDGNLFASWTYDSQGRAISSQHAGGAELTTVSYGNNASTVTDANGNAHTYNLQTIFGTPMPVGLTGAPIPQLGGDAFSYDANGFVASKTDYDGNVTAYVNDNRGDQFRAPKLTVRLWLARLARCGHQASICQYKSRSLRGARRHILIQFSGDILNKTVAAGSETRKWNYTYNNAGQVLTAKDPLGNATAYTYDGSGNLASETDALGHKTRFTSYDGAGRLLSFTDPNGLVTNLSYDTRGRLTERNVGGEATLFSYDAAGNLTRVTRPDASYFTYIYDAAHRLTHVVDALNNQMALALDGNDNRTNVSMFDPTATLTQTRSFAYDLVNRLIRETGAQGQTTAYTL